MGSISSTLNKGFQITFDNGITVSVQFGMGNYCSNRMTKIDSMETDFFQSETVEILCWDAEGDICLSDKSNPVIGHANVGEIPQILTRCQQAKSRKDLEV
jgi:hypothetical protein